MQKQLKICVIIIFLGTFLFLSCHKEVSCEGCYEKNQPPVAAAGNDQVISLPTDSVSLDGSASRDPDGSISKWLWKKISGPTSFNFGNATAAITAVKDLSTGTYLFELNVTDNGGLSDKDTVSVIVDPVLTTNHPPIANAGLDRITTLPVNSTTLNGTGSFDPDNNPITFNWSKISGPTSFNISNISTTQPQITSLVAGVYQFKLTVTDNGGLSDADTVEITVNSQWPPNEVIIDSLTWNYWHDVNDPLGMFDDIYLAIYDTTNMLSYTPTSIFVKLDSVGTWVPANPIVVNVNCTPPYIYNISQPGSPNTLVLFILSCPLNFNLIGTGASVKLIY